MSLINEYRQTETAIKELQERLQSLNENEGLKKELEFEQKLRELMAQYSKSLRDITAILDPQQSPKREASKPTGKQRRERQVKVYEHPDTGERIETKGGNHKLLKEWKNQHGADVVEGWLKK